MENWSAPEICCFLWWTELMSSTAMAPLVHPTAVVDAKARLSYQPFASQMVSRGIDSLSPEERMELQAVSKGLRYREWLRYVGKADSPEMKQAYKSLTGNSTGFIDAVTPDWLTG
jgi:hypothetical protein